MEGDFFSPPHYGGGIFSGKKGPPPIMGETIFFSQKDPPPQMEGDAPKIGEKTPKNPYLRQKTPFLGAPAAQNFSHPPLWGRVQIFKISLPHNGGGLKILASPIWGGDLFSAKRSPPTTYPDANKSPPPSQKNGCKSPKNSTFPHRVCPVLQNSPSY